MKKLLLSTALGAMLIAGGVAVAQPDMGAGNGGRMGMGGALMADMMRDGKITKAEVTDQSTKAFAAMDSNADGKVTKEERQALHQKMFDERFAKMDADGNGQISKAEFQAVRDVRKAAWAERRGGEDGARMGRMHRGKGDRMGGGMKGMRGMDADRDGTITRAEFMAMPMAMFDRADANKDGTVTMEEMKAARAAGPDRPHHSMKGPRGGDMMPPPPPPAPPQG